VKRAESLKEDASLIREVAWSLSMPRMRDKLLALAEECESLALGNGKTGKTGRARRKPRRPAGPVVRGAASRRRGHEGGTTRRA